MFLMDMPTAIVVGFALGTAFLWFYILFPKNAVLRAIFQGVTAILETQFGWALVVALVLSVLVVFGIWIRK